MRNTILFVVFFAAFSLYAQSPTSQGSITLNGNLSFSSQSYEDRNDNRNALLLNPQAGYFFVDNFSVGLSLNFQYLSFGNNDATSWGIGPNLRYYFNTESIKPFVSVSYAYMQGGIFGSNYDRTGNGFTFAGGLDYFIVKNVAIETTVSYQIENLELPGELYSNTSKTNTTIQFAVGINFFLY